MSVGHHRNTGRDHADRWTLAFFAFGFLTLLAVGVGDALGSGQRWPFIIVCPPLVCTVVSLVVSSRRGRVN